MGFFRRKRMTDAQRKAMFHRINNEKVPIIKTTQKIPILDRANIVTDMGDLLTARQQTDDHDFRNYNNAIVRRAVEEKNFKLILFQYLRIAKVNNIPVNQKRIDIANLKILYDRGVKEWDLKIMHKEKQ